MPDASGNFKGVGWSQKRSDAWERVFGRPETHTVAEWLDILAPPCHDRDAVGTPRCRAGWSCGCVPRQPAREVPAPRFEDELADDQAARDGYNPTR